MNTLESIIASLEASTEKTAEAAVVETPETPVVAVEQTETMDAELQKRAAYADFEGRMQARAFVDEMKKIAVEVTGMTPNTGAVPENPAVQVSNTDAHEGDVAKVESILQKLTMGGNAKGPQGAVHEQNVPVAASAPIAVDEHPVAADVKKTAGEEVIEALYQKWFN